MGNKNQSRMLRVIAAGSSLGQLMIFLALIQTSKVMYIVLTKRLTVTN